jgi:SRSO17 transposase
MELVPGFGLLLQGLSATMTSPSFASLMTVLTGWLFAGRRTITSIILAAGQQAGKHFSSYHRLFSAARWSLDALGLAVFDLIEPWLEAVIGLALDDTLARKRGLKVFGAGMHHDPLLSTRKTAVLNWGHSWVVLGVLVKFPFRADRYFCLPILFRLYLNREAAQRARRVYRTRPELAVEMLTVLGNHRKNRRFHLVADSLYGGQSVLLHLPANCDLTSRLHLDARLYDRSPERKPGTTGRPRKRGARLPTPRQMLRDRCRQVELDIYGRRDRVRLADSRAIWHAQPNRMLRIVASQPLTGGRTVQAFYSTCADASAEQVLAWYAQRWAIEQTFQEAKSHLGFEQPQGWSRRAVERTAPLAMLLYSLIVLWFADHGHRQWQAPLRAWYRSKRGPAFGDMLDTLRQQTIQTTVSTWGLRGPGSRKIIHTLQQVAVLAA